MPTYTDTLRQLQRLISESRPNFYRANVAWSESMRRSFDSMMRRHEMTGPPPSTSDHTGLVAGRIEELLGRGHSVEQIQRIYNELMHDTIIHGTGIVELTYNNNSPANAISVVDANNILYTADSKPKTERKSMQVKLEVTETGLRLDLETKKLSNKQNYIFKKLHTDHGVIAAVCYIESINGKRNRDFSHEVRLNRLQTNGTDTLADKKEGTILMRQRASYDVWARDVARPNNEAKDWIGVEIECLIPRNEEHCCSNGDDGVCDEESDCGGESTRSAQERLGEAIMAQKIRGIRLKNDGSLTDDSEFASVEVVVLTRLSDMSNLEAVCKVLNKLRCKVDGSCGLHVHLDCRDGSGKRVANRLVRALPILKGMIPRSRLDNTYCQRDRSLRGDRYAKINTLALRRHKTVEIRMHSGTTDYTKISNWIYILSSFARFEGRFTKEVSISNLVYLSKRLNWSLDLCTYIIDRTEKFLPKAKPVNAPPVDSDTQSDLDAALAA